MLYSRRKTTLFWTSKTPVYLIALTAMPLCIQKPTCTGTHFLFIHPHILLLQTFSLGLAQGSTDVV